MAEYGLLGKSLKHSFSPLLHKRFGGYDYVLFEKTEEELSDFLTKGEFKAINVTVPYKKKVIPFCSELSKTAERTQSVNVIVRRNDNSLYGDNTDYFGLEYLIVQNNIAVKDKKVLILGNGGAAATVKVLMKELKAAEIIVLSRSGENNYDNIGRFYETTQLIINTTPVGMYPDNGKAVIDMKHFTACEAVIDIIFNPLKTRLLLSAESHGIKAVNGLQMLVAQAAGACESFIGKKITRKEIDRECKALERQVRNIVLIGMPGSGKSTFGKVLAELTGREFFDCDVEYLNKYCISPSEEISKNGEELFREKENQLLSELSAKSGIVLATGGGVVTREENLDLLRQNGKIIYIRRAMSELSTEGRPLSAKKGIEQLLTERKAAYESWSDLCVDNDEEDKIYDKCRQLINEL